MIYNSTYDEMEHNGSDIKIVISTIEVQIHVLFSMGCWMFLEEQHKQGVGYRTSFAKTVFYMYEKTDTDNPQLLTEEAFIHASDEILCIVLDEILRQNSDIKLTYDQMLCQDVYERFYKTIETMLTSIQSLIRCHAASTDNRIHDTISKITESLTECIDLYYRKYQEKWIKGRETLSKYGWYYFGEFSTAMVNYIHDNREYLNKDDVDRLIVNWFRNNRCEALKSMVNSWRDLPYFACRERIFYEAMVNHSRKCFNSSVTLLVLHTEGILSDFVRLKLKDAKYNSAEAIKRIKLWIASRQSTGVSNFDKVVDDVVQKIEEVFNEHFDARNPDAASNESRHKMAHGHVYETETEVNSLKQFLYIDTLYHVLLLSN